MFVFLAICTTGCGRKSTLPIKPSPPAEAAIQCQAIPQIGSTDDEAAQWEAEMIDIYSACAIRHHKLIEWVEGLK